MTCTVCGKGFHSEAAFSNHPCVRYKMPRRKGSATCPRCKYRFANRESFQKHIVQYEYGDWCHLPEEVGLVSSGTRRGYILPANKPEK